MNNITKILVAIGILAPNAVFAGYLTSIDTNTDGYAACSNVTTSSGSCPSGANPDPATSTTYCDSLKCITVKGNGNTYYILACDKLKSSVSSSQYQIRYQYALFSGVNSNGDCVVNYSYVQACASGQSSCNGTATDTPISASHVKRTRNAWTCAYGCQPTTSYLCNYGYYGTNVTSETTGCDPCPQPTGWTASEITTPSTGTAVKDACYIAKGTTFSDVTGSGVLTADCRYPQ